MQSTRTGVPPAGDRHVGGQNKSIMEAPMPRAIECVLEGRVVGIDEAIGDRNSARAARRRYPDWRCTECKKPVRPHAPGGGAAGHFEHTERNPGCSLSDPER